MRKILITFLILILSVVSVFAQKLNRKIVDTKTQKEILYGKCNVDGLKTGEFGTVFKMEYKYYVPDSSTMAQLKPLMKKVRIHIVMGSWCGDSQQQLPRFIKLMDMLKYKTRKLDILCIDHFFKAENFEKGNNGIEKVPTFIIYRKNKEIGRIIETPTHSLEKDLLNILKKKQTVFIGTPSF
jgi:hypothetical protein